MGAVRYIADHIPHLELLLKPFNAYIGKVPATKAPFSPLPWTFELLDAYNKVWKILNNPEIFFQLDPSLPRFLETDASDTGFGAFLFQTSTPPAQWEEGEDSTLIGVRPLAYFAGTWPTTSQATAVR